MNLKSCRSGSACNAGWLASGQSSRPADCGPRLIRVCEPTGRLVVCPEVPVANSDPCCTVCCRARQTVQCAWFRPAPRSYTPRDGVALRSGSARPARHERSMCARRISEEHSGRRSPSLLSQQPPTATYSPWGRQPGNHPAPRRSTASAPACRRLCWGSGLGCQSRPAPPIGWRASIGLFSRPRRTSLLRAVPWSPRTPDPRRCR